MLTGALFVPLAALALATTLAGLDLAGERPWRPLLQRALGPTGWIGLPILGAGLGALASLAWEKTVAGTLRVLGLGLACCVVGSALIARPIPSRSPGWVAPQSVRGKTQAIRRAAFRSPATVASILHYTRDPDPTVREQAVLALGVNLVVAGIEHATPDRPSRYQDLPLRDSLRARLLAALADDDPGVRGEAARALWKAPRTFGPHPAAAESLAAILDRALAPGSIERLTWLALDAAAGSPHDRLKLAAARFAAATPDSELARAARLAAR
jgi:hypothetical protein